MSNELLKPTFWASVSGGKDSLFMLNLILNNLDKYQLDGVVHYELEIDYPFVKNVIDYMEKECTIHGIRFVRIKPRKSWEELYSKYGFPTRYNRWCNSKYKLDCYAQLKTMMASLGYSVINYIGYCYDEKSRYEKRKDAPEIYPLVDFQINESMILEWAKEQPIFNDYYVYNRRCGCMLCPMTDKKNLAYLCKYYPEQYKYLMDKARASEIKMTQLRGKPFSCFSSHTQYDSVYIDYIIHKKYLKILEDIKNERN